MSSQNSTPFLPYNSNHCDSFEKPCILDNDHVEEDVKENGEEQNCKTHLSNYARLGPDDLKKDLEECQDLVLDLANIELDTPPDFWLSHLDDAKKLDKATKNHDSLAPWCFSD
ncbi:NAC domain-containing protein 8 [Forsythia ovata]|uniref:NAC domain-containing protein 8 n=1 Tax=Forsythia ovata TaxID=205694 RepID=A0ABD1T6R8_9LAMI